MHPHAKPAQGIDVDGADETSADHGGTNLTENRWSQGFALALPQPSSPVVRTYSAASSTTIAP